MLTFTEPFLQAIAAILGWSVPEVEESITELNREFMRPFVNFFSTDPAGGNTDNNGPGYYHCLSAPGYMDSTDWSGPFETLETAVADMLRTYAD